MDLGVDEVQGKIQKNPFKIVPLLMYHSAKYAQERVGKEPQYSLIDLTDVIDAGGGIRGEGVVKFLQAFTDSLLKGVPKEPEVSGDGPKKK